MSHYWSFLSLVLTIIFLQIVCLHSTPVNSETSNENLDIQHTQNTLHYLIKNILTESNPNEQAILFNQLREYLNHMCINGYFGSSHAHSCQHIVDIVHQLNKNTDDDDINNEQHNLQKRFFCNGFTGCRNSGR